jgi:secreted trypsin-like serine protease
MRSCPTALVAGAVLGLAPALLAQQTGQNQLQKTFNLGGQQVTMLAQSNVVAAGDINNARYSTPVSPAYNGVGSVRINTAQGAFICTGSLLADGKTVLTAAHCLSGGITPTSVQVNFYPNGPAAVTLNAASWQVNPAYTGAVIDENDIGLIHLTAVAPANISRYAIADNDPTGSMFEFVGYGQKGSNGAGVSIGAGFSLANRKQGLNSFDTQLGDPAWNGFWDDPTASVSHVLLADFDNGTTGFNSNDGLCWIGQFGGSVSVGTSLCNAGTGIYESDTGGGDSGGPGFVYGKIASVTSFGLTFGQFGPGPFPDIDNALNSSFGEFAGFTDVAFQSDWIYANMDQSTFGPTVEGPLFVTPEPSTNVMLASGLLGIAIFIRRRRSA